MTDEELIEQVALQVSEPVFILTRESCLKRVEVARGIALQSSLFRKSPELVQHLDNIFDAIGVMVSEVLLTDDIVHHASRVILPIIKAERIRGGEMVKKAAAMRMGPHVWKGHEAAAAIRALPVHSIVEFGDGGN